jgi:hypothetical protein
MINNEPEIVDYFISIKLHAKRIGDKISTVYGKMVHGAKLSKPGIP